MKKSTLRILMVALLVLSLVCFFVIETTASVVYTYRDADGATQQLPLDTVTGVISPTTTDWGASGQTTWYVVTTDTTIAGDVAVRGTVNLVIPDGVTLTVNADQDNAIGFCEENDTLNVFSGANGTGSLIATGMSSEYRGNTAFFGYGDDYYGILNVNGGTVTAQAGNASLDEESNEAAIDIKCVNVNAGKLCATAKSTCTGALYSSESITVKKGAVLQANNTDGAGLWICGGSIAGEVEVTAREPADTYMSGAFITCGTVSIENGGKLTVKSSNGRAIFASDEGADIVVRNGGYLEATGAPAMAGYLATELLIAPGMRYLTGTSAATATVQDYGEGEGTVDLCGLSLGYMKVVSGPVAKINTTEYYTLQAAIDAVPTDGTATTITLCSDVKESISLTNTSSGKVATIDLAGHTWSAAAADSTYVFSARGKFTLKNGTVELNSSGQYIAALVNVAEINGVTINVTSTHAMTSVQAVNNDGRELTMSDCTVNVIAATPFDIDGVHISTNGECLHTLNNVKIDVTNSGTGDTYAVSDYSYHEDAKLVLKGTETAIKGIVRKDFGTLDVSDCVAQPNASLETDPGVYVKGDVNTVFGDKTNSRIYIDTYFTVKPVGFTYMSSGMGIVDNLTESTKAAYPYVASDKIVRLTYVNASQQTETKEYNNLASAVSALPVGSEGTITLRCDVTLPNDNGVIIPAGKTVVLDLAGYSLSFTRTSTEIVGSQGKNAIIVNSGALLTVKNGTVNATSTAAAAAPVGGINCSGALIAEKVTVNLTTATSYGRAFAIDAKAAGSISDCTANIVSCAGNDGTPSTGCFIHKDGKLTVTDFTVSITDKSENVFAVMSLGDVIIKGTKNAFGAKVKVTGAATLDVTDTSALGVGLTIMRTKTDSTKITGDVKAVFDITKSSAALGTLFSVKPVGISCNDNEGIIANEDATTKTAYPYVCSDKIALLSYTSDSGQAVTERFSDFAAAISAAPTGKQSEVVLFGNVVASNTVMVSGTKTITLDLNGFSVTVNNGCAIKIDGDNVAALIKNGTVKAVSSGEATAISQPGDSELYLKELTVCSEAANGTAYTVYAWGGTIDIVDCTLNAKCNTTDGTGNVGGQGTSVITVKNCTFNTTNDYVEPTGYSASVIGYGDEATIRLIGKNTIPDVVETSGILDVTGMTDAVDAGLYTVSTTKVIGNAASLFDGSKSSIANGTLFSDDPTGLTLASTGLSIIPNNDTETKTDYPYTVAAVVAVVDGNYFKTLQEAIDAVPTDGTKTTVKLLGDVNATAGFMISGNRNVVLDLDGHTIAVTGGIFAIKVVGTDAVVTVKNGTVKGTGSGLLKTILQSENSVLTLKDLTVSTKSTGETAYAVVVQGFTAMENCVITCEGKPSSSFTIAGVYVDYDGDATIKNCSITATHAGGGLALSVWQNKDRAAVIKIVGDKNDFQNNISIRSKCILDVTEMTDAVDAGLNTSRNSKVIGDAASLFDGSKSSIADGTLFSDDPTGLTLAKTTSFVIANSDAETKTDYPYTVGKAVAVVGSGETAKYFGTLQEAFDACGTTPSVVTLLADADSATVARMQKITLVTNGKLINGTLTNNFELVLTDALKFGTNGALVANVYLTMDMRNGNTPSFDAAKFTNNCTGTSIVFIVDTKTNFNRTLGVIKNASDLKTVRYVLRTDRGEESTGVNFKLDQDGQAVVDDLKSGARLYVGISAETGTLTVKPVRLLYVASEAATKMYDGTILNPELKTAFLLAEGDVYVLDAAGIIHCGTETNEDATIKVYRNTEDVTSEYEQRIEIGELTITPRSVTLTSENDEKQYDSTALTNSTVNEGGDGFVAGEGVTFDVTGSQTEVGDSPNTFTYSFQSNTSEGDYEITAEYGTLEVKPREVIVKVEDASKVYLEEDPDFPVIVTNVLGDDEIAYTFERAPGQDAGTYALTVAGEETQGYYHVTFESATLTIKKSPAMTVEAFDYEGIYDGNVHGRPVSTNIIFGVMYTYYVDGEEFVSSVGDKTYAYPVICSVGTYTVDAYVSHKNYETRHISYTLTVLPVDVTVTIDPAEKIFGTEDPTFTCKVEGLLGDDTVDFDLVRTEGEDVGAYSISAVGDAYQGNYHLIINEATFNITPSADLTVDAQSTTKAYDGTALSETAFASESEGTLIEYSLDGETWTEEAPSITDVGTIEVFVRANNPNYVEATTTYTLTVEPREVTVSADNFYKVFGEADPDFTATVEGLLEGDEILFTLSRAAGENTGKYAITPAGEALQGNYSITYVAGNLTITPTEGLALVVNDYEGIYDGKVHGEAALVNITDGTVISYSVDGGETWTNVAPTVKDFGTVEVIAKAENENYAPVSATYTLTVARKAITVKVLDAFKVYGKAEPAYETYISGIVAGETVDYTVTREAGENVGTYAITVEGESEQGNYEVSYFGATLTVQKSSDLRILVANETKVFDGKVLMASVNVSDENGTTIYYSLNGNDWNKTVPAQTKVGTLAYYIKAVNANYNEVTASATISVSPRTVTVTAENLSKVFGEADPVLVAAIEGLVGSDTIDFAIDREAGENVGTYAITVSGESVQGNYKVTYVAGTLEVTASNALEVSAIGYSGIFDGADHFGTVAANIDGATIFYSPDGNVWTTEVPAFCDVCEETVYVKAELANYVTATAYFDVKIDPKDVTVTAENLSKVFGEEDPALTAIVEGLVGEDTVVYTLSREAGENVGNYAITADAAELQGNYRVTTVPATLTVEVGTNLAIVVDDVDVVYDGTEQAADVFVNIAEGTTLSFSVDGGETWSDVAPTLLHAGEIEVTVKAENKNYETVTVTYTITVSPISIKVISGSASKTYDGTALTAEDFEIEGFFADGEGISVEFLGSLTKIGYAMNSFDYSLINGDEGDYEIEVEYGTLYVAPTELMMAVSFMDPEAITLDDAETLRAAVAEVEKYIADNKDEMEEEEYTAFADTLTMVKTILASLDRVADAKTAYEKLPALGDIKVENESAIQAVKAKIDALTDDEKVLLGSEITAAVEAMVSKVADLHKDSYTPTAGAAQEADLRNGDATVTFLSSAPAYQFSKLTVDGTEVSSEYYEVKDENGTTVVLKADFLKTLGDGAHTVSIVSTNGHADTTLTVSNTNFYTILIICIVAGVVVVAAIVVVVIIVVKKKRGF